MFIRTIIFVIVVLILAYFHSEESQGYPGGVTVYDFGASWCEPCREDIKRDNKLSQKGIAHFVFVEEDVDPALANSFIASTHPNFEVQKDPTHSIAKSMGATNRTPSVVIVGPKGKKVISGSLTEAQLESEIAAMK